MRNHAVIPLIAVLTLAACGSGTPAPQFGSGVSTLPISRAARVHRAYSPACPCVYVANTSTASGAGIITIYPTSATGNFSPGANVITGTNTGLTMPEDINVDASGKIYVANTGNSSVTTYAAGSSGNATPLQTISGTNTGLNAPAGISVDTSGNIYVSNGPSASITVFASGANGNATPIRTIAGTNTGLSNPKGLTVAGAKLFVANVGSSSVTVYSATSNGNVSPLQTLSGANTGISGGATDVARRGTRMYVTSGNNQVGVFPANANGNVTPLKTISGTNTLLANPLSVALGQYGRIWVANAPLGLVPAVTAYNRYAILSPGNNNIAPIRNINGSATQLAFPAGLFVR